MLPVNQLQAFLGTSTDQRTVPPGDLPTPPEVVYVGPNPDSSRKKCENCVLYATAEETCYVLDSRIPISPTMVCSYHVYGEPMERFEYRLPMLPLTPEQSGLINTEEGTSCSNCAAYDPVRSMCMRVSNMQHTDYAVVEPLGCCARWSERPFDPDITDDVG